MSANTKHADGNTIGATVNNWADPGHLRDLHVDRGWTASDIARAHDIEPADVLERLKEIGVFQGQNHPPKSGLARKLWEQGIESSDEG